MKPGNNSMQGQPKVLPRGKSFSQTTPAPKLKLPPVPGGKVSSTGNTP